MLQLNPKAGISFVLIRYTGSRIRHATLQTLNATNILAKLNLPQKARQSLKKPTKLNICNTAKQMLKLPKES